jgi:3-deoxy-D-arabino-heptulosonate 7-phosphate (DAHP) synthase class II
MAYVVGPNLVRDGLVLYLDAANPKSYPGRKYITEP